MRESYWEREARVAERDDRLRAVVTEPGWDRDEAIREIRRALKARSGKAWSVTGGRGTAWGWITITSPPARRINGWQMSPADCAELGELLGLGHPSHDQGESVPASSSHRTEYVNRANGREFVKAEAYWD